MCWYTVDILFCNDIECVNCLRQHVPVVMGVLRSTVVLLTRRHVVEKDDMMYAKMMELRNHILCGSNTFRFVTLKELELTPAYNSYGLLGEHGKYESCIVVSIGNIHCTYYIFGCSTFLDVINYYL